jgi:outer membrane protein
MKKIATTLLFIGACFSTANADMMKVEAGLGLWDQKSSGKLSYTDNGANGRYSSSEPSNSSMYFWALLKHPVPIVPNMRLEYTSVEDSGVGSGKFKEFDISNTTTTMVYDMKQYDIIPYYNILDNTAWITLDLGLDIKVIEASVEASPRAPLFGGYTQNETIAIPLLYVRARVEIPSTNIGLESDVKYVSYSSNSVYDIRVKVDYTFDISPVVQPAIELGYRVQNIDVEDGSDFNIDVKFEGLYAGFMLRF